MRDYNKIGSGPTTGSTGICAFAHLRIGAAVRRSGGPAGTASDTRTIDRVTLEGIGHLENQVGQRMRAMPVSGFLDDDAVRHLFDLLSGQCTMACIRVRDEAARVCTGHLPQGGDGAAT